MFYFLYVIVRRVFEIVKEIEEIINILQVWYSTFSYRIELKLVTKPGFLRLYSAGNLFQHAKLTHLCSGEWFNAASSAPKKHLDLPCAR